MLEQVIWIQDTVAAPLDDLDFIIQTFHKSACLTVDKVIQYLLHPRIQCRQKCLETTKFTFLDTVYPRMNLTSCSALLKVLIKYICQLFTQFVG